MSQESNEDNQTTPAQYTIPSYSQIDVGYHLRRNKIWLATKEESPSLLLLLPSYDSMPWLSSAFILRLCSIGIFVTVLVNMALPSWQQSNERTISLQRTLLSSLSGTAEGLNNERSTLADSSNNHKNHTASSDKQTAILEGMIQRDSTNPHKHFSACLLIRDDNQLLSEWISYHYHTLKLRYLVIAVDPDSQTSPHNILQRWQKTDLEVLEWSDAE